MRLAVILPLVAMLGTGSPVHGFTEDGDAQQPAELRVTVLDQTGAALITASVTVVNEAGVPRVAAVDEKGVAVFAGLAATTLALRVEAEAFETYEGRLALRRGANAIAVELPLAGLNEEIVVREDVEDVRGNSFSRSLGDHEIAELPDDPDELEQMLMQMAGPGATMMVNGFRGGRLPPKSQIRSIRFRMNSFAAENHEAGGIRIDIQTKPGTTTWRGMSNLGFRDGAMNARNAFAEERGAEQYRRFGFNIDGPLRKGTTSFAFSTDGNLSYDSQTIVAATPGQLFTDQVRRPFDQMNAALRIEHALTDRQTLLVEYQRRDDERRNLGVGDFDLPSRAYSRQNSRNVFRTAVNGLVAPRIANELKLQFEAQQTDVFSSSDEPSVIVVDSFAVGGAGQQTDRGVRQLEIANNVDFSFHKRHAVRAGVLLEAAWYNSSELRNGNGTFTFPSLEAYAAGQPTTYRQRTGGTEVAFSQYQVGLYAQDDITVTKALSVSLGVRQELQTSLGDRLNMAPRVGFTWSPNKWTFRGGWGIFNDWYESSLHEQTLRLNGVTQQEIVILQPGFPDPFGGVLADVLPPSIVRAAGDLQMPWVQQASFGAERSFGDLRLQASYMLQRGRGQLRSRNANAPIPGLGRPDPLVGNITEFDSDGRSTMDRLQVNVNYAQPQRRLFLGTNYVLSRQLNHADSALSLPVDNYDLESEWGYSSQDARHRVFVMAGFGLPKGLRMFWNSQYASATPYTIITGLDDNNDSVNNDRPAGVARNGARGAASWNINARLSRAFFFGPAQATDGPTRGPQIRGGGGGRGGPRRRGRDDDGVGAQRQEVPHRALRAGLQPAEPGELHELHRQPALVVLRPADRRRPCAPAGSRPDVRVLALMSHTRGPRAGSGFGLRASG
jgi:hypothetical protein